MAVFCCTVTITRWTCINELTLIHTTTRNRVYFSLFLKPCSYTTLWVYLHKAALRWTSTVTAAVIVRTRKNTNTEMH